MNKYSEQANRMMAIVEQSKAACREACFEAFDKMGPGAFAKALAEIKALAADENRASAFGVVVELGLLEMDLFLAEWMSSRVEEVQ